MVKRESTVAASRRYVRMASAAKPAQAESKAPYFKESGRKKDSFPSSSKEDSRDERVWTLLPRRDESVVLLSTSEGQFGGSEAQTESQDPHV